MGAIRVCLVPVIAGLCIAAFTQDKSPNSSPGNSGLSVAPRKQSDTASPMEKIIASLAGSWSVSERYEPSPEMPKGGTGSGEVIYRPGPGGQSLIEEYHSKSTAGEYSGLGIIWWDDQAQGYLTTWCDSSTRGCKLLPNPGKWEGDRLVLLDETEVSGVKTVTRETYSNFKGDSFLQTLETIRPDGVMKRFLTITNTRVSATGKQH